jgi:hypothetical protein
MRRILSPDMFNLARQVRAATDHAANAAGRLAGVTRALNASAREARLATERAPHLSCPLNMLGARQ